MKNWYHIEWIDDIPDGGIKTKSKTNNSDCELNDKHFIIQQ